MENSLLEYNSSFYPNSGIFYNSPALENRSPTSETVKPVPPLTHTTVEISKFHCFNQGAVHHLRSQVDSCYATEGGEQGCRGVDDINRQLFSAKFSPSSSSNRLYESVRDPLH